MSRLLASAAAPARSMDAPRRAAHRAGLRGLIALRDEVGEKLRLARDLELEPPERYGFSLATATRLFLVTASLYRWYFRSEAFGLETLPEGPLLLVANHGSHVLSWDGANILSACLLDAEPPRLVHGLGDHRLMELPVLGHVARRIGAVDGRRPACTSLLRAGAVVLTFPEGTRALAKPFRARYRLAPFGSGFVHVAMTTGAPIVPVAVIGSEEEAPLLANPRWLARLLGTPVAPITPTLVLPLPVKYRLHFGPALYFSAAPTLERVAHGVEQVQRMLEQLIHEGLATRPRVFL